MLEGGHEFDGRPLVPFDVGGHARGRPPDPRRRDPLRRHRRGLLAAQRLVRGRSGRRSSAKSVPTSRSPSPTGSAASACSSARTRPCSTPASSSWPGRTTRAFSQALRASGITAAALPHPERRHRHAGGGGGGVSRLQLRVGADELDARRRVSLQARRGARHRRGRHHHRHRQPAPRLSPRGQQRRRDRRGPHALPDARPPVARAWAAGRSSRRPGSTSGLTIGPASVGYRLTEQALVFGGDVLTVTDVAVAAGLIDLGDRARVAALPAALVNEALARIRAMIEEGVDRMKTDAGETPLIAVGGGSFLVPGAPRRRLRGPQRAAPGRRQRGGRRDRPGERRGRPDLPGSVPGRGASTAPAGSPRTRRSRPAPTARPSTWWRWRTCRWPTCPATRCAPASASSERSRADHGRAAPAGRLDCPVRR